MKHETVIEQMTITSDRLVLRPLRTSDAGLLSMYMADEKLADATRSVPHPLPPGATEAMIARSHLPDRTEDFWAMDATTAGLPEIVGVISLNKMDREQSEVFYWVAPAFWNVGFATEAVRTLIDANPHKAKRFFAEAFKDNAGSASVLTNVGFDYLGDAEAFCIARNGIVPTWTYTLKTGA